jgi:hypothetical protein
MNSTSSQRLASQLPATVGVPFQALVLGGVAILALIVGAFSVGAGFALLVLGLLAALILDFMMWQQHEERTPATTSAPVPSESHEQTS